MKIFFLLTVFLSLIIAVYGINHPPQSKSSQGTRTGYPRLGTIFMECKNVQIPDELDGKKRAAYCQCVNNPADSRSIEDKKLACAN